MSDSAIFGGPGGPVHIYPPFDLIRHDLEGEDCICGPDVIPVERYDGSMGWMVSHHSLDGREASE